MCIDSVQFVQIKHVDNNSHLSDIELLQSIIQSNSLTEDLQYVDIL